VRDVLGLVRLLWALDAAVHFPGEPAHERQVELAAIGRTLVGVLKLEPCAPGSPRQQLARERAVAAVDRLVELYRDDLLCPIVRAAQGRVRDGELPVIPDGRERKRLGSELRNR
jgi:hypothetical protein